MDPFTATVTALEARLRTAFPANKWFFELTPHPMTTGEFRAVTGNTPLLALSWMGLTPVASPGRRFTGKCEMRLTIIVKNQSQRSKRFLGDARGPGLFPAIGAAVALIQGHTKDGLGTFFVTGVGQTYAEGFDDLSMAIATVDIEITLAWGDYFNAAASEPDFLRALANFSTDGEDWGAPPAQPQQPQNPFEVRP
jgi:hypothetical protein